MPLFLAVKVFHFTQFSGVQSTNLGSFFEQRLVIKPISFMGQTKLEPCTDYFALGIQFEFYDEHPQPFQVGVSPCPWGGTTN